MPDIPKHLSPARYIGEHAVELGDGQPYYNIDSTRKQERSLNTGDTIMLPAEELYGKTLLHDPHQQKPSVLLGLGRVVLPEHADLSGEERALLGYEHHLGRPDMEPLEPLVTQKQPVVQPQNETSFIVPADRVSEDPDTKGER